MIFYTNISKNVISSAVKNDVADKHCLKNVFTLDLNSCILNLNQIAYSVVFTDANRLKNVQCKLF